MMIFSGFRVPVVILAAASAAPVGAQTQQSAAGGAFHDGGTGLQLPDWIVMAAYLLTVLGIGWHLSRRSHHSGDYFIAAQRPMHPLLIGISMYATVLSTISYLGKPGEIINKGPILLVGQILAIPFAYVIVGYVLIPKLMQQRVTSAYELLEQRLGVGIRLLGAVLFIILRLIWMGLLIYLASVALVVIIGIDGKWIPAVSATAGFVAVIYTSIGGLRTVVVTDALQFGLLLFGAVLTIVIISAEVGGFHWFPTGWLPTWDHQPLFSFDPHVRVTVFGATLTTLVWRVATAGGDQTSVQRYMATENAAAARNSYLVSSMATLVATVVLGLVGLALLGFYSRFPQALGPGMTPEASADHLFPYFIAHNLPVGMSGLVASAAMAAAMSSVDSGVNSITAVVMKDFLQRFGWHPRTEGAGIRFAKWMAFGIGAVVVVASLFAHHVPGNFFAMSMTTANLAVPMIFALFVLAIWIPFATPLGAWLGCIYGLTAAVFVAFWGPLTGRTPVSFQLVGPISFVVDLSVGLAISRWGPPREERRRSAMVACVGIALLVILATVVA